MTIGEAIRTLRKQAGLKQQTLARLANISGEYLCNVEKGNSNPTVEVVTRLAEGIGVPVSYIFWYANERPPESLTSSKAVFELVEYLLTEIQTFNRKGTHDRS